MIESSNAALITFVAYTIAVFLLAMLSNRAAKGKEFVGEYFLGSRNFGVWAFALTFAATNASGGTFMGFPALVYTHGWTLALWIAAFMIMPLVSMGLIGKRLNQVARKCNALTIPEVLKGRFESPAVGLVATLLLIFFMFFYLVAQFKAGGKILSTLFAGEPLFQSAVAWVARAQTGIPWVNQAEPDYLVCLLVFSAAVIAYVVYGGFRAVVWTDVMQGLVMFVGVLLMLGLALWQVGGLGQATRQMARMTPPEHGTGIVSVDTEADHQRAIPKGTWIQQSGRVFRLAERALIPPRALSSQPVAILRITTPFEVEKIAAGIEEGQTEAGSLAIEVTEMRPYRYGAGQIGSYVTSPGPSTGSELGFLAVGSAISFFIFWPFAAVMSSVDSFLLVVSSAVVRDIYQGHINRRAPAHKIKLLSYSVTVVVGILAVLFVLNPPTYLQDLIVFATGGLAACFLIPMVLSLYWRRMTSAAAIAAMLGGAIMHLALTCWGYLQHDKFQAYEFLGLNPFVWDLAGSTFAGLVVVGVGPPVDPHLESKFFSRHGSRPNRRGRQPGELSTS